MIRITTRRRGLFFAFGVLFGGAVLLAAMGLAAVLPRVRYPEESLFVAALVVADLLLLFVVGSVLVRRLLVWPMLQLGEDARRIASGEYHHRIRDSGSWEVQQVQASVDEMANRLIADQALLAANVVSLDATNRELIDARDQLIRTARLASVGTLAAGIAHEVGNPLGAVIAFVDVAKGRAQKEGADTELLDSIRAEAQRIDRIVRGLLDYARPRDSGIGPNPPADVLTSVRELLETQGKLDGVEATWAVLGHVPDVYMEPHRLEQVMVNLLLNALDALDGQENAQISVQLYEAQGDVARLPIRRAHDPEGVNYLHRRRVSKDDGGRGIDPVFNSELVAVIQVDDNGPGIPEEDLDRVFDPFYTTKEPGKGTGLGLAICARLVEGMGGRIDVASGTGGGASFRISLPGVHESDEHDEGAKASTPAPETRESR